MYSLCENSNPNAWMPEKLYGDSPSGMFGYSHLYGGYPGGQAEYVRVPFADVGPFKAPNQLSNEQLLFLTDILPTGYMAAENCNIQPGDTVAVWGCGPVGQFAIQSAWWLGAERVIAIDHYPHRLEIAAKHGKAETLNFDDVDDYDGWDSSPPESRDGASMANSTGWRRTVVVERVDPAAPMSTVASDKGLKRITVTVYQGATVASRLVALRSNAYTP